MKKKTKLKTIERDVRCLKLLKTINKTTVMIRFAAGAVVCALVAVDVLRMIK